jgi:hypothetical protein
MLGLPSIRGYQWMTGQKQQLFSPLTHVQHFTSPTTYQPRAIVIFDKRPSLIPVAAHSNGNIGYQMPELVLLRKTENRLFKPTSIQLQST